jgi:hypothetical protein
VKIGTRRRTYVAEPLVDAAGVRTQTSASGAPGLVPDYAEPTVGWRSWFVLWSEGRPRLSSTCYATLWQPGREVVASCRRHPAPDDACHCGIYASRRIRDALPFLISSSRPRVRAVASVVGRVALWGRVVECAGGWRGERAYPVELFVTSTGADTETASVPGWWRPRYVPLRADDVATALAEYDVPVSVVTSASLQCIDTAVADASAARAASDAHGAMASLARG